MLHETIRCPNCAEQADADDRFCAQCGFLQPGRVFSSSREGRPPAIEDAALEAVAERLRHATVGRFDVLRLLGHGGMAAVFLAYDIRLARKVALKVMLPRLEVDAGMSHRFVQEARISARLTHQNIIIVHSVEELGDLVLFVMNLIDGASLEQVLQGIIGAHGSAHAFDTHAAQSVLIQVATALDYAHGEHVVHRDIKPSNVMLTVRGDATITDFGIAKVMASVASSKASLLMGTPTYMSPEQCQGRAVSGASDQYSFGVMAYEMFAGVPPFSGSAFDVMTAHVHRQPVAIKVIRPDVPGTVADAIMKTLQKEAGSRFESMADVADALSVGFNPLNRSARAWLGAAALTARDATEGSKFRTPRSPTPLRTPVPPKRFALELEVGETTRIGLTEFPITQNHESQPVEWQTGDAQVVSVGKDGQLHGNTAGTTVVKGIIGSQPVVYTIKVCEPTPAELRVSTERVSVPAHEGFEVGVVAHTAAGLSYSVHEVRWSCSQDGAVEIGPASSFVARQEGTWELVATLETVRALVVVEVTEARVASVQIADMNRVLLVDETVELQAVARDVLGNALDRDFLWSSDDPRVLAVDHDGSARCVGAGTTTVRTVCGGVSGELRLDVEVRPLLPSRAVEDSETPAYETGVSGEERATLPDVAIQPDIAAASVADYTPAERESRKPSTLPARAQPGLRARRMVYGTIGVAMIAVAVSMFTKPRSNSPTSLADTTQQPIAAPALDRAAPSTERRSVDSAQQNQATPTAPGSEVSRPSGIQAVDAVIVQPLARGLVVGDRVRLIGQAIDRASRPVAGAALAWRSSDTSIVSVNAAGVVMARKEGDATIVAVAGTHSTALRVTVTGPIVATPPAQVDSPTVTRPTPAPVATRIELQVTPTTLRVGEGGRWNARALTATGTEVPNVAFQITAQPADAIRFDDQKQDFTVIKSGAIVFRLSAGTLSDTKTHTAEPRPEPPPNPPRSEVPPPASVATNPVRETIVDLKPLVSPLIELLDIAQTEHATRFFRGGGASAKALFDWMKSVQGERFSPPTAVARDANGVLSFDLPVRWTNSIGQCRTGAVAMRGTNAGGQLIIETAVPPVRSSACTGR